MRSACLQVKVVHDISVITLSMRGEISLKYHALFVRSSIVDMFSVLLRIEVRRATNMSA